MNTLRSQLGAFCPLMENGGEGEHRPWMYDNETLEIYRNFVSFTPSALHLNFIAYSLFSFFCTSFPEVHTTLCFNNFNSTHLIGRQAQMTFSILGLERPPKVDLQ